MCHDIFNFSFGKFENRFCFSKIFSLVTLIQIIIVTHSLCHTRKKNGKYIFTTNKIDFILKFVVVILTIPFICKAKVPIAHARDCQAKKKKTKKSRAAFVYVSVCVSVQNLYVELASSDFVLSGSKLKHSFK